MVNKYNYYLERAKVAREYGNEDLANAIAIGIEKVFGAATMTAPGPATQLFYVDAPAPAPIPVTGSINLALANPKYVFTGA